MPPGLPTRVSTGVTGSLARSTLPFPPPPPPPDPPAAAELLLPQAATASALTTATAIAGFFPRSILILSVCPHVGRDVGAGSENRMGIHNRCTAMSEIEHGQWPPVHGARPRCCEVVTGAERGRNRYSAETFAS